MTAGRGPGGGAPTRGVDPTPAGRGGNLGETASAAQNQAMSPTPGPAVGVLIVDDQAPFRRAARMVMAATPGFDVIAEAESGEEALDLFERLTPGLVLMDINLPGINGIEATRRITEAHPDATVLLLSTYQAADLPRGADTCGAAGYINKEEFGPAVVVDLWKQRST
jgi:two-component system invasion response regulator UvrY